MKRFVALSVASLLLVGLSTFIAAEANGQCCNNYGTQVIQSGGCGTPTACCNTYTQRRVFGGRFASRRWARTNSRYTSCQPNNCGNTYVSTATVATNCCNPCPQPTCCANTCGNKCGSCCATRPRFRNRMYTSCNTGCNTCKTSCNTCYNPCSTGCGGCSNCASGGTIIQGGSVDGPVEPTPDSSVQPPTPDDT